MKNIYLLPTDKPSKILKTVPSGWLKLTPKNLDGWCYQYQNIYITNDEEIKEGDWGLSKLNEVVLFGRSYNEKFYKKIILTTDQFLIDYGVQAIDDEFLEWFVFKTNDSGKPIDIVEIDKYPITSNPRGYKTFYEIIIPKDIFEEAAEKLILEYELGKTGKIDVEDAKEMLIEFTQWQQKQMYNEEEVQLKLYECLGYFAHKHNIIINGNEIKQWFKQFKKK